MVVVAWKESCSRQLVREVDEVVYLPKMSQAALVAPPAVEHAGSVHPETPLEASP